MEKALLIGIDGGATHSTAVAAWNDGTVAAVAHGGGLNINNIGTEAVRGHMESMVHELCKKAGAAPACVCAGMAALDAPADEATTEKFTGLLTRDQLDLQSDAYVALMGLTQGKPGMIAICGTGSMLMLADDAGDQYISGGWGYLMEDSGSGYAIAREGLLAAIDEYEGTGPATPLTACACEFFGMTDLRKVIDFLYSPDFSPDKLAAFARHVLAEADKGDPISYAIIRKNMRKLAGQAAALFKKAPEARHMGLYGGIFAHSEPARSEFSEKLRADVPGCIICSPEFRPELGAIIHLLKKRGELTCDKLENLKNTYERTAQ